MPGKIIINLDQNYLINVSSELNEQELYEAYVGLTAHIATKLNNFEDIKVMSMHACNDALKLFQNKIGRCN